MRVDVGRALDVAPLRLGQRLLRAPSPHARLFGFQQRRRFLVMLVAGEVVAAELGVRPTGTCDPLVSAAGRSSTQGSVQRSKNARDLEMPPSGCLVITRPALFSSSTQRK